jgi:anti-sigma B factor antagonist
MTKVLEARCEHERPTRRLEIEGDLTIHTARAQKERLLPALRAPYTVIEVDLAQVTEIDTAGLQLLLMGCDVAMVMGGALKLVRTSPAVAEVIELLSLQQIFASAAAHCPNCADARSCTAVSP